MHQDNMAAKRERYPNPITDEVLQDLNRSKFFSKLDLNSAYDEIESAPESRDITTFGTHEGLYPFQFDPNTVDGEPPCGCAMLIPIYYLFMSFMFSARCAPNMNQKVLQQLLHV